MMTDARTSARSILRYGRLAIEVLLVGFFVIYVVFHWDNIRLVVERLPRSGLALCVMTYSIAHLLAVAATRALLAHLEHPKSYASLLSIYLRRLPAKYLPGGIWHTVGRGGDLLQAGVPTLVVGQLLALEQVLAIWWSGFLGLLLVASTFGRDASLPALLGMLIWISGAALTVLYGSRRGRYARAAGAAVLPSVSAVYVAGWACLATAFSTYLWIGGMAHGEVLRVAASYFVSWAVGALAFFSPQGMGVFEFSMNKAMTYLGPVDGNFLWFVGSYRLVVLAADLAAWSLWLLWRRVMRPSSVGTSLGASNDEGRV